MTRLAAAQELFETLVEGGSSATMWEVATRYLEAHGFDRVIHLTLSSGTTAPRVRTTMTDAFVDTYQSEGFAEDDPFLRYCLPSPRSIKTGIAYIDDYDYIPQRGADLIELAAADGFNAGFSVITALPSASGAEGWNLGSSLCPGEIEKVRAHHGTEIKLALMALRGRLSDPPAMLSKRETEVVDLMIDGRRDKEIAATLKIKPVTVEFHIASAKRKFGAVSRGQLTARYVSSRQEPR